MALHNLTDWRSFFSQRRLYIKERVVLIISDTVCVVCMHTCTCVWLLSLRTNLCCDHFIAALLQFKERVERTQE